MRLWPLSLPLILVVYACSSDPSDPPVTDNDAGATDASADQSAPVADGGADVETDSGCVPPTPSTEQSGSLCTPYGACPTCAAGIRYRCTFGQPLALVDGDGGTERLTGCLQYKDRDNTTEFCCPASWVRHNLVEGDAGDPYCVSPQTRSFVAPANADGTSRVPLPANCTARPAVVGATHAAACCK